MEAENARLLNRLTKQQEINQSLRVENSKLKAEVDRIQEEKCEMVLKCCDSWNAKKDEIAKLEAEVEKLKEKEKEWQHAFRPFGGCLTLLGPSALEAFLKEKTDEIEELKKANMELRKLAMEINIVSRLAEKEEEVEKLKAEVEKLKRQQCDTEYELTHYKDYIMWGAEGWAEFAEAMSHNIKGNAVGINWGWLEDDFNQFSVVYYDPDPITGEQNEIKTTMIRDKNEIQDIDNPTPEELEEHKEFFSDCVLCATIKSMELIKVYDFTEE